MNSVKNYVTGKYCDYLIAFSFLLTYGCIFLNEKLSLIMVMIICHDNVFFFNLNIIFTIDSAIMIVILCKHKTNG